MSVSDNSDSLLLIMESPDVTHNIDCLFSWNLFARYLLRFVLFVTLLRNLLMKFGGISEQSSNVTMSPVPDPWSSLVPSFKLPSKYRSVITSHLLNKEDVHDLVIESLGKVSKGLHPRRLLLLKKHRKLNHTITCIWLDFSCASCLDQTCYYGRFCTMV